MNLIRRQLHLTLILSTLTYISVAQQTSTQDAGFRTLATFGRGQYDTIDLSNLYILQDIPVLNVQGSSNLPFSLHIMGYPDVAPGFMIATEPGVGVSGPGRLFYTYSPYNGSFYNFSFQDGSGAMHPMGPLGVAYLNQPVTGAAIDGSGYTLTVKIQSNYTLSYTVYDVAGNVYNGSGTAGNVLWKWAAGLVVPEGQLFGDTNHNLQVVTTTNSGTTGSIEPAWNPSVGGADSRRDGHVGEPRA